MLPIVAGLRFVINVACLIHSRDRPDVRLSPRREGRARRQQPSFGDQRLRLLIRPAQDYHQSTINPYIGLAKGLINHD
jgi:hypothetical protein